MINTTDMWFLKLTGIVITLIVVFTIYQNVYMDSHNDEYESILSEVSCIDIFKLDMTKSENGIPITEGIINT